MHAPADPSPPIDPIRDGQFDVFISYCRRNLEAVKPIYQGLQTQQRRIWIDWADIPPSVDWRAEIYQGISAADSFIAVLSPEYLASYECRVEYETALQMNKRLIPIVCAEVNPQNAPDPIAALNWIFCRPQDDLSTALRHIAQALDTDIPHLRAHTRLLLRAQEWQTYQHDDSFLLRGTDLETAEQWRTQGASKQPQPTQLQLNYIDTSRQVEHAHQRSIIRLQRWILGSVSAAFLIASGLGVVAYRQYQAAAVGEIKAINTLSESLFNQGRFFDALTQSLRVHRLLKSAPWVSPEITQHLIDTTRQAAYWVMESNRLEGHTDWILAVEFSPDGQWIASGGGDKTVRLWQLDGKSVGVFSGHPSAVFSVAFSPDSQRIAAGHEDGTLSLWQRDGTPGPVISTNQGYLYSVLFTQDGRSLLSAGWDGTIRLWSIEGKPGPRFTGHDGASVRSLAQSPDGKLIASAGADATVRLWQTDGQSLTLLPQRLKGAQDELYQVKFSPDGQTIAAVDRKGQVTIWDRTGKRLQQFPDRAPNRPLYGLAFSPDGQILATASTDQTIDLWRWQDGTFLESLKGHSSRVNGVSFSPDRKQGLLVSAGEDTTLKLWRMDRRILSPLIGHQQPVNSVSFSPDGSLILSGSSDKTLRLWTPDGQLKQTWQKHTGPVYSISISPDGQRFASGGDDRQVLLWKRDGSLIAALKTSNIISTVQFSPQGNLLAAADMDGKITLWKADGTPLTTVQTETAGIIHLRFSPDGQTIAYGTDSGEILLWNVRDLLQKRPQPTQRIAAHNQPIQDVAFSADGQMLASASSDRTVKLWKRDGTWLKTFSGHRDLVQAVRFSPKDPLLASASSDRTIKLWNLDGSLIGTLNGHTAGISSLSFSPDGQQLASASDDRKILVWNLHHLGLNSLLDRSCQWLIDYLTTNPTTSLDPASIADRRFCQTRRPS